MSYGMYTKKVMQYFKHPKNMGRMKNPDGVGKVGNMICLLPDVEINKNDHLEKIENIKTNDKVLSHDGFYNEVGNTFKRKYKGEILKIKNRFGTIFLTPEHEILAIKLPKTHHFLYLRNKIKFKPSWYHAQELEKGDVALYPITKEAKDTEEIKVDLTKLKFDFKSKKIPSKIKINDEFLRLCGYYLSEGHISDKVTSRYVSFTFSLKEKEYADDVIQITKNIFGIDAKKRIIEEHNSLVVYVHNVFVVRLFKNLFGKGAVNKSIPHFMMALTPEKQKHLLIGLWHGDGFVNKKKPRAGYSTISYKIAQQIKSLLLRQSIIPSIYEEKERIVNGVRHKKSYRIHLGNRDTKELAKLLAVSVNENIEERNDSWIDDDFAYVPIVSISKEFYNGFVHNLHVENTKSFTTDSFSLHNCGDVMWLYIKVKNNRIVDIKFETFGCVAAIATSSMITELVKGKIIERALKITREDIVKSLGGLPPIKTHCSVLAADALSEAVYDYLSKNKLPVPKYLLERHERIKKETETVEERHKDYIALEKKVWKVGKK